MTGVVVLNYNNAVDIKVCVDSIVKHLNLQEVKLVVVDNGSSQKIYDEVGLFLKTRFSEYREIEYGGEDSPKVLTGLTYVRIKENLGYARGNNVGLQLLFADTSVSHVLIINSDIILTEDILPSLLSVFSFKKNVGAVSPLLYKPDGGIDYCCARNSLSKKELLLTFSYVFQKKYSVVLDKQRILKKDPQLLKCDYVNIELPSGSCMLFRKDTLENINGFDEHTFLYYEENILYKRLSKLGYSSYLLPSVGCIHVGGATTNKIKTAYFLKKCNYKSLMYYLKSYEDCTHFELLYMKLTGGMRLLRLKLGMLYRKLRSLCN